MIDKQFDQGTVHIFHYIIASADMYYTEEGQCDVFLGRDEYGRIHIWGQTANTDSSTRIELCQVFLEYGLYCSAWCTAAEAHYHMQNFGERLGHGLAKYMRNCPDLLGSDNPALYALEQIFESIGADFSTDYLSEGVQLRMARCPVQEAAKHSGMRHVDLARDGMSAMCRSLVLDMNPHSIVDTSPDSSSEFIVTIRAAEPA